MTSLLSFRTPASRQPRARVAPATVAMTRTECMPPSLVYFAPVSGGALARCWHRLMFWLLAPAPQVQAPPPNRLGAVKREFGASLADLDGVGTEQLRWRVQQAHSLRELWHLRSDVYNSVALAISQDEAEARLLLINQHFPTRAPRSQFAPL
ncbi:MAG: hypothetical protein ACK57B_10915 [Betaproteobacteria bacterium]|jgi:hypothetical protein